MRAALLAVSVTGGVSMALWQPASPPPARPAASPQTSYHDRFEQTQKGLTATGATSCSSSLCHGGATPRPGEVFLGIEYDRWYAWGRGNHFRAYKVLYEDERSDRMAKLLYGPDAVAKEQATCRACHALDVEPARRGRAFDIEDGVNCESCHGRSEKWHGLHQNATRWRNELTTERRTAMGFYDTRDLVRRAELCLSCHLGTDNKPFTHQILAAGHPPLTFELAGDLFNVPKHWRDEQVYLSADEGSWFHVRVWAVGQAVMLREQMRRLAAWAAGGADVDYVLFECYACHHGLTVPSWRQHRGTVGKLGEPLWDSANWAMCEALLDLLPREQRDQMAVGIDQITGSLTLRGGDRATVRAAAETVAALAGRLAEKAAAKKYDRAGTFRIIRSLTRDRDRIAGLGYRAAVQTFSALYALYKLAVAESNKVPGNHDAILETLVKLEDFLYDRQRTERPGDYDALAFAGLIAEFERQLDGS